MGGTDGALPASPGLWVPLEGEFRADSGSAQTRTGPRRSLREPQRESAPAAWSALTVLILENQTGDGH